MSPMKKPLVDAADLKQTFARQVVAGEMESEIVVCDFNIFQNHYLPFVVGKEHVDACIKHLRQRRMLTTDDDGQPRLKAFELEPSNNPEREDQVFAPLTQFGTTITKFNLKGRQPRYTFKQTPNKTIVSEILGSNHQIDGFFTLIELAEKQSSTSDAALVAEFKKSLEDSNRLDNRQKLVGAANHVMNDDPRRMFTYGMTIEDTEMTLWYFSRSHSAKSRPFNFVKDTSTLVSVFMSFIFATEEEIGYDPTVRRIKKDNKIVYVYEVKESNQSTRYFKTIDSLSEYRSMCISGRMTRVWKAVELKSSDDLDSPLGPPVVLKDLWLDQGASTERDIQSKIFRDIETFALRSEMDGQPEFSAFEPDMVEKIRSCLKEQAYKKYFLEIICDQQGHVSKSLAPGAKAQQGVFIFEGSKSRMSSHPTKLPSRVRADSSPTTTRPFRPKQQYRVVFKEVCKPLHHVAKLSNVMQVVRQCFVALQLLYCSGWVHRDISSGNVLAYELDGVYSGKLSDLEYAKQFASETSSGNPKTGTPFFMAFEIQDQRPLAKPKPDMLAARRRDFLTAVRSQRVRYNFQHDLESLWWLILWFITARVDHLASQDFAQSVFQNTHIPSHARRDVFLENGLRVLPDVLHESLRPVADDVKFGQVILLHHYMDRQERNLVENISSYSEAYKDMDEVLRNVHNLSAESVDLIVPSPLVSHVPGVSRKRPRPVEDEGGNDNFPPHAVVVRRPGLRPRKEDNPDDEEESYEDASAPAKKKRKSAALKKGKKKQ